MSPKSERDSDPDSPAVALRETEDAPVRLEDLANAEPTRSELRVLDVFLPGSDDSPGDLAALWGLLNSC